MLSTLHTNLYLPRAKHDWKSENIYNEYYKYLDGQGQQKMSQQGGDWETKLLFSSKKIIYEFTLWLNYWSKTTFFKKLLSELELIGEHQNKY